MSYARFGWDGSDVYVFGTTHDGQHVLECCGCIRDESRVFLAGGQQVMIDHLLAHRAVGDTVPQDALDRLAAEIDGTESEYWATKESVTDVMRRNPHMFGKTQQEMDEILEKAKEQ